MPDPPKKGLTSIIISIEIQIKSITQITICIIIKMEDKVKTIIYIILTIIFSICLIYFSGGIQKNTEVLAASGESTSNLQLMARAINRRGKRREL